MSPRTFMLRTMAGRMAHVGDLWVDLRKRRYSHGVGPEHAVFEFDAACRVT